MYRLVLVAAALLALVPAAAAAAPEMRMITIVGRNGYLPTAKMPAGCSLASHEEVVCKSDRVFYSAKLSFERGLAHGTHVCTVTVGIYLKAPVKAGWAGGQCYVSELKPGRFAVTPSDVPR